MAGTKKSDAAIRRALDLRGVWYRAQYRVTFKRNAPGPVVIDFLLRVKNRPQWLVLDFAGAEQSNKDRAALAAALKAEGYRYVTIPATAGEKPNAFVDSIRSKYKPLSRAVVDQSARKLIKAALGDYLKEMNTSKRRLRA